MDLSKPTTSASDVSDYTANNTRNGREGIEPVHITIDHDLKYCHVGREPWEPGKVERFIGTTVPTTVEEAIELYNLDSTNPASHVHIFKFDVPFNSAKFVILKGFENEVGTWQAVIPQALIPYIKVIAINRLH